VCLKMTDSVPGGGGVVVPLHQPPPPNRIVLSFELEWEVSGPPTWGLRLARAHHHHQNQSQQQQEQYKVSRVTKFSLTFVSRSPDNQIFESV